MANLNKQSSGHQRESKKQKETYINSVIKVKEILVRHFLNPFACKNKTDLFNIATGEKAKSADLINAKTIGIKAIEDAAMQKSTKIEAPNIVTFSGKTSKVTKNKGDVKIYQDESAVTRALCFMQQVDDNTRHVVFSHEWSEYHSCLFEVDHRF